MRTITRIAGLLIGSLAAFGLSVGHALAHERVAVVEYSAHRAHESYQLEAAQREVAIAKWEHDTAKRSSTARSDMRSQSHGYVFSTVSGVLPAVGELIQS
jgi:hypothetical protein